MIRFDYDIETFPRETSGYHVPAGTEGTLDVWLNDSRFLHAEGVLLVEFAIFVEVWLRKIREGKTDDLHYASMDFEEEPIFALEYDPDSEVFLPSAIWATGSPVPIPTDDARRASEDYIERLGRELAAEHGVNLSEVLGASIEPNPQK